MINAGNCVHLDTKRVRYGPLGQARSGLEQAGFSPALLSPSREGATPLCTMPCERGGSAPGIRTGSATAGSFFTARVGRGG